MAKPPRPIPLPLLAKINAIIVDLAVLADTLEAERNRHRRVDRDAIGGDLLGRGIAEEDQATSRERLNPLHHVREGGNVIPFPLRHPRR